MKKIIVLALLGSLLVPTSSNAAAMKPCPKSKLGTINAKNEKCIKNGIFYRWVKLEQNQTKPTPVVTPSPVPVPSPTPTPTATPAAQTSTMTEEEAYEKRIALDPRSLTPCTSLNDRIGNFQGELLCLPDKDGKLVWHQNFNLHITNPKPTPTPVATTVKTLKSFEVVYKKIGDFYNNNSSYKLSVIKSPKVNSAVVDLVVSKYEKALSSYPIMSNKKITWVFMNETERDFYLKKNAELNDTGYSAWWENQKCQKEPWSICSYGNNNVSNPIFYMLIGSTASWQEKDNHIIDHEAVHMFQMLAYSGGHPNCWIIEGQANAIGFAMQSKKSDISAVRFTQVTQMSNFEPNMLKLTADEWAKSFQRVTSNSNECFSKGVGYSYGMIAVESLFNAYDAYKVDSFMVDFVKTKNFSQSLMSNFAITESQFYSLFGKYMYDHLRDL